MKKIISILLTSLILLSILSVVAFANGTDVEFSIVGSEGKPGEAITVQVNLDKNPGIWACRFDVNFDGTAVKLISVENGDVFTDSQFTESLLTNEGLYKYYAQMDGVSTNNTKTGKILTLTFQVLSTAPNGDYPVTVTYPDDGDGWFFDANNIETSFSVSTTNEASITVMGSSVNPEDTTVAVSSNETTTESSSKDTTVVVDNAADTTAKQVVAYVTDNSGNFVYDDEGNIETTVVTGSAITSEPQYETDAEGNFVKNEDGEYETYYVDENGDRIDASETTSEVNQNTDNKASNKMNTIIVIAIIVFVIIAVCVAVIVVVLVKAKKNKEN